MYVSHILQIIDKSGLEKIKCPLNWAIFPHLVVKIQLSPYFGSVRVSGYIGGYS
jgi:hypothetical protein